ncbi:Glycosyltransferase involved in cell wall bisynthesis [Paucidesulfovibrio gracilis DSM 16080]|uniref:Glycosyltransferase involved in cell wall bisynthesis n=1 Tax=Paucidesulfovibrio gracilis DSM 16080 TaxID=1121449 RepID=A0A1T4X1G6_9BACT|nr:glycosyltransferase family 4 protein [Paucidesulfovibrio gracilis]SKA83493.1 Glycosyltransferase involved in cell wall bisynthesis [Paucidesulfovibrio gracilis DSM 16080]
MKIAQVAPLHESVPPKLYGGTERVVHFLTEELVRKGYDVALYASGDSHTSAELRPCCDEALRLDPQCQNTLVHHVLMLERVMQDSREFDIVHFHMDYIHFPLLRRFDLNGLTTFHWRLDLPDFLPFASEYTDLPVSSISLSQRRPLPQMNWVGNVYHGLPRDLLQFHPGPGRYLAFLGRLSPEKGIEEAVDIAIRSKTPLKIAAKINDFERDYYEEVLRPLFRHPLVEFLGEIDETQKNEFLGNASALLFPILWPEPFGLVMIEALACGTPVIAFPQGSVPEVLRHGVSGWLVDDVDSAVDAVGCLGLLSRSRCRAEFDQRFTSSVMADNYVRIYKHLLNSRKESGSRQWKKSSRLPVNTTFSPRPH